MLLDQGLYLHFKVTVADGYFGADQGNVVQFRPPSTIVPHQKAPTDFLDLPDDFQCDFFFFGTFRRGSILLRLDEAAKDDVSGMAQHRCPWSEDNIVRFRAFDDGQTVGFDAAGCQPNLDDLSQAQPLFQMRQLDVSAVCDGRQIDRYTIALQKILQFHALACLYHTIRSGKSGECVCVC